MSTIDFGAHMADVARRLLGEPTSKDASKTEWRYGADGKFSVTVDGPKRGRWFHFPSNTGGGVLDLIRREKGFENGEALEWMRTELGIDIPERPGKRGRPAIADYVARIENATQPLAGTPAERYLRDVRGLPGPFPPDVGYHPRVWHKEAGRELPALVCRARDDAGAVGFLHVVFLDERGHKADVDPVKKTFGAIKDSGAAVRVPAADAPAAELVLCEGIEDALSVAFASGRQTWACCGTGFSAVPVLVGTDVLICAQNDPAGAPAERAIRREARKLQARGFPVRVALPPSDLKDWNDTLRRDGADAIRRAFDESEARASWRDGLIYSTRGEPKPLLANAIHALRQHWEWRGAIAYDEFRGEIMLRRPPPWETDGRGWTDRPWTDRDDLLATEWLQRQGIHVSATETGRAIQAVAGDRRVHPVRDRLDRLVWDGVPRLDAMLETYFGARAGEPTTEADDPFMTDAEREAEAATIAGRRAYLRAVGSRWMISAVARIYEPGCQVDHCPILEGEQGTGKSTALRTLAGDDVFSDQIPDLRNKDAMVHVHGVWILELGELDRLRNAEVTSIKAFVTRRVDKYRPPYGHRDIQQPRQTVFAGTVNPEGSGYLRDPTGGRRFWPVACGAIDLAALRRDRDQLLAEAVARYRAGEAWHLDTPELNLAAAEEQEARYDQDPWQEAISAYIGALGDRAEVKIAEILDHAIGLKKETWTKRESNRVGDILRHLKWQKRRASKAPPGSKTRPWVFVPPSPSPRPRRGDEDGVGDAESAQIPNDINTTSSTSSSFSTLHKERDEKSEKYANDVFSGDFLSGVGNGEKMGTCGRMGTAEPAPPEITVESRCTVCGVGSLPAWPLVVFADGHLAHGTCPPSRERKKLLEQAGSQRASGRARTRGA